MFSNNNTTKKLHRLGLGHSVFRQICFVNLTIYYAASICQRRVHARGERRAFGFPVSAMKEMVDSYM